MGKLHYARGHLLRAPDPADPGGPITFVAATEGMKADGLDLQMDRARLDRFRANPVIGYGHDYWGRDGLPIGRAVQVQVDRPRLLADVVFDMDDSFAAQVDRKYRQEFMHAVSVGFDVGRVDDGGVPEWWELYEISAVPIPLDADAVAEHALGVAGGRRHAALELLMGDLRAGKVLSAANAKLVGDAIAALQALMDAAGIDDDDPRGRAAVPSHSTATVDEPWDGPAQVAAAPGDAAVLEHMHAWRDPDLDPETKQAWKLPHHATGTDTAANLPAVRNALARLPQSAIPEADHPAVQRHLRRHLDDAEEGGTQAAGPQPGRAAMRRHRLRLHTAA